MGTARLLALALTIFIAGGGAQPIFDSGERFQAGDVVWTGRASARAGFMMCDGTAVSRAKYAALFDAIGTTFGAGDGSTTFNIPDARQRFLLGKAASGTGSTLGGTGGAIDHSHTVNSHDHSITAVGNHDHTVDRGSEQFLEGGGAFHDVGDNGSILTGANGGHDHGGLTGTRSPGTNTANPPFLAMNCMIKF